jgi:hypothetical protein
VDSATGIAILLDGTEIDERILLVRDRTVKPIYSGPAVASRASDRDKPSPSRVVLWISAGTIPSARMTPVPVDPPARLCQGMKR